MRPASGDALESQATVHREWHECTAQRRTEARGDRWRPPELAGFVSSPAISDAAACQGARVRSTRRDRGERSGGEAGTHGDRRGADLAFDRRVDVDGAGPDRGHEPTRRYRRNAR